jgi:cobalt/nickel transport system permease protein
MLLLYRLIFVIAEEAVSGAQAQSARLGYDGLRRSLNSLALLIANLLERSLARVRRLQIGLAARQFDGDLRVLPAEYDWSSRRMMFTGCLLLGIAAVGLLGGQ